MESGEEDGPGSDFAFGKDAEKLQSNLWKDGYRDGKDAGRKEGFQESFNQGYEVAFQLAMQFGLLRGMLDALVDKDATLSSFLKPVIERLKEEAAGLMNVQTDERKSQEENIHLLRESYTKKFQDIQKQFVSLYPYGEEEAVKLLQSLESLGSLAPEFSSNKQSAESPSS